MTAEPLLICLATKYCHGHFHFRLFTMVSVRKRKQLVLLSKARALVTVRSGEGSRSGAFGAFDKSLITEAAEDGEIRDWKQPASHADFVNADIAVKEAQKSPFGSSTPRVASPTKRTHENAFSDTTGASTTAAEVNGAEVRRFGLPWPFCPSLLSLGLRPSPLSIF